MAEKSKKKKYIKPTMTKEKAEMFFMACRNWFQSSCQTKRTSSTCRN